LSEHAPTTDIDGGKVHAGSTPFIISTKLTKYKTGLSEQCRNIYDFLRTSSSPQANSIKNLEGTMAWTLGDAEKDARNVRNGVTNQYSQLAGVLTQDGLNPDLLKAFTDACYISARSSRESLPGTSFDRDFEIDQLLNLVNNKRLLGTGTDATPLDATLLEINPGSALRRALTDRAIREVLKLNIGPDGKAGVGVLLQLSDFEEFKGIIDDTIELGYVPSLDENKVVPLNRSAATNIEASI